ncbi:MAG TPA: hypothetical protein VGB63_10295 [Pedobacter sp.]|jgi:hypothetical protein
MKKSAKYSAIKEKFSGSILRTQKAWAIWMGSHVNRLSRRGKKVMLVLFILVSVSWSLFLIIRQSQPVINTGNITKPVPMDNKDSTSEIQQFRIDRQSVKAK